MRTPSRRHRLLAACCIALGIVLGGVGIALALTPIGTQDFAFIASSRYAIFSSLDSFWATPLHPIGLALLALGAGTTGAACATLIHLSPGGQRDGDG